jgi:hypothetical protein
MNQLFQVASATLALAMVTACASPATTAAGLFASRAPAARVNDYGNIRWNKVAVHVYKSKSGSSATLTFWAKDGYFTYPNSCPSGGKFVATPGNVKGNPNRYERVKYSFVAKTSKADQCTFTAVLNNTGSPPIATLTVDLNS